MYVLMYVSEYRWWCFLLVLNVHSELLYPLYFFQADNDADESEKPESDPLGLTSNDLRDIQNLHSMPLLLTPHHYNL